MDFERVAEILDRLIDCKTLSIVDFDRAAGRLDRLTESQMVHDMDSKQGLREIQMLGSGWEEAVCYILGIDHCLEETSMCTCLAGETRFPESMKAEEERRAAVLE